MKKSINRDENGCRVPWQGLPEQPQHKQLASGKRKK